MSGRPRFRSCPDEAYFIQPCGDYPTGAPRHKLGTSGGGELPCDRCGSELLGALTLDASDARLLLPPAPRFLELILCPSCASYGYTYTGRGEILSLQAGRDSVPSNPRQFAMLTCSPAALHAVPERILNTRILASEGRLDEAGNWAKRFDWSAPVNQVGGIPVGPAGSLQSPDCPLCSILMSFLASVAAAPNPDADAPPMFGQALFFLCRGCTTIVSEQVWQVA